MLITSENKVKTIKTSVIIRFSPAHSLQITHSFNPGSKLNFPYDLPIKCSSSRWVQSRRIGLQSAARSSSAVSGWWLPTRHCRWPLSTTIVRRPHVRHPTHPHSSWPSIIRSRWTTSVEQSSWWTSSSQHFPRIVSSSAKDSFVFELSQAPSDVSL